MADQPPPEELEEEKRREIYRALVEAEDLQEMPRTQACRRIARRFRIAESLVRRIEREGRDRLWSWE